MTARINHMGRSNVDYMEPKEHKPRSEWTTGNIRSQNPDISHIKSTPRDYTKCPKCGGKGTYYSPYGVHGRIKRLTKCDCKYGNASPV